MTNSLDNLAKLADRGSTASDRWLFIMALLVLGFVVVVIAKFFMKQYLALVADFKQSRDQYQRTLLDVHVKQAELATSALAAIKQSSEVIGQCTVVMEQCTSAMNRK